MTDRVDRLTVVLTHDIRDDDVEPVMEAILMIKGVASVAHNVVDGRDYSARQQVRRRVAEKILALYQEVSDM